MLNLAKKFWPLLGLVVAVAAMAWAFKSAGDRSSEHTASAVRAAQYEQDLRTWASSVNACERGKIDRTAIANALDATLTNFQQTDARLPSVLNKTRRAGETTLQATIVSLRSRTDGQLDCLTVFPRPEHHSADPDLSVVKNRAGIYVVINGAKS